MSPSGSRETLLSHIGRLSQIGGISHFVHAEGKAKGTSTLRIRTARGFEFWVVPDKGMDIYEASFRGQSLCWHSPAGIVHPAYYSPRGTEWLKGFAGGLLTTCGLTTAGAPSQDKGEDLGLHGPISNTPAENVCWTEQWEGDDCIFRVSGRVRESSVFGPNLLLERAISTSLNSASLTIKDVVENQGRHVSPLMVLYHFNFGFPLLSSRAKIYARSKRVEPVNDLSAESLHEWDIFDLPQGDRDERVYFHDLEENSSGNATVVLANDGDNPTWGIALRYDPSTLPRFNQWKMSSINHFVLGLEPANCNTLGRAHERSQGTLQFLDPGERREFNLELRVLEDAQQVQDAIRLVEAEGS